MIGLYAFIAYAIATINAGQATTSLLKDYAAAQATLNGVSVAETLHIISNESGYNSQAVGDHGSSIGMVQIHLSAHPNITRIQALSPIFSVEYLVSELKKGNCTEWSTCDLSLEN